MSKYLKVFHFSASNNFPFVWPVFDQDLPVREINPDNYRQFQCWLNDYKLPTSQNVFLLKLCVWVSPNVALDLRPDRSLFLNWSTGSMTFELKMFPVAFSQYHRLCKKNWTKLQWCHHRFSEKFLLKPQEVSWNRPHHFSYRKSTELHIFKKMGVKRDWLYELWSVQELHFIYVFVCLFVYLFISALNSILKKKQMFLLGKTDHLLSVFQTL